MIVRRSAFITRVLEAVDRISPFELADKTWDNVGLLLESVAASENIIVCNDLTDKVLLEAVDNNVSVVIAYHPPWFRALKDMTLTGAGSLLAQAAYHRISLISPHSALDAVNGGINDWLLSPFATGGSVAKAIKPCAENDTITGHGRMLVDIDPPLSLQDVVAKTKLLLGLKHLRVAASACKEIRSIAVCPGSGGSLLSPSLRADCVVTGELSHHSILALVHAGCNVILTEHTNSERPYLQTVYMEKLRKELPEASILYSEVDAEDPISIY